MRMFMTLEFVMHSACISGNVNIMCPGQLFEIYNTKLCLTRLEHYKGPYEKNESYVVRSQYKWTNGVYVSV